MADPSRDPADEWEEDQTLAGGVLFFFCAPCCALLQILSYGISCHKQEKSVQFFNARCKGYHFYMEILICSDCAVAAPFKMPSNTFPCKIAPKGIIAADGSGINIPTTKETLEAFGTSSRKGTKPQAAIRLGCLYDVMNRMILESDCCKCKFDEMHLAEEI